MEAEVASQPDSWRRVLDVDGSALPKEGERIAVLGCGTSWFIAQSYAALRESRGQGESDAFSASEYPHGRSYDRVLGLSRSGTTTELLEAFDRLQGRARTVAIVGDSTSPMPGRVDEAIALSFADEQSVVQTRFATTALMFLRASLGDDVTAAAKQAESILAEPLADPLVEAEQYSFLGQGWTIGLAHEAALKLRESSQSWTESYPAMDYRHGPIAIAQPGRVTWMFGETPPGLADQVRATGAAFVEDPGIDPVCQLVRLHRVALERARRRGLDPDHPRSLTRAVELS